MAVPSDSSSPQETASPAPCHLPAESSSSVQRTQPIALQPMNPQQAHPESTDREVELRGGDACPGRFCFCIPCPIPCDFCII